MLRACPADRLIAWCGPIVQPDIAAPWHLSIPRIAARLRGRFQPTPKDAQPQLSPSGCIAELLEEVLMRLSY